MDSNLKDALKEIIINTFKTIDEIYNNRYGKITYNNGSRLIFPCYSSQNKTNQNLVRVSEQELRFIFIETFCRYCKDKKLDYYYSIETPSQYKYVFSEKIESGKPLPRKADKEDESPVSARFDMAIHNKDRKIVALIEFKNNESDSDKYEKDFIKLYEEKEDRICLFIDLIEASNSGTLENGIKKRLSKIHTNCKGITYIAHSMCPRNDKSFKTVYDGDIFEEIDGWEKITVLKESKTEK
jgi:hypothetical protein